MRSEAVERGGQLCIRGLAPEVTGVFGIRESDGHVRIALRSGSERTGELVADHLVGLHIPFAFLTGYASTRLMQESRYEDRLVLPKPSAIEDLRRVLTTILSGSKQGRATSCREPA